MAEMNEHLQITALLVTLTIFCQKWSNLMQIIVRIHQRILIILNQRAKEG